MIDTIRFKIPITRDVYQQIKKSSTEFHRHNNLSNEIELRIVKGNLNIGSFDRKISLILYDEGTLFLELSLPKYLFGHNIFLLKFNEVLEIIEGLSLELNENFGEFPDCKSWEIMRLDLCYAWKFKEKGQAEKILSILRSYSYPRKKKYFYDTSIMCVGSTYAVKFYLKNEEVFKNDFKEISKYDEELAYEVLNSSTNVLRFEITMRKKSLETHFLSDPLKVHHLQEDTIEYVRQKIFDKFLRESKPISMTSTEAYHKLKAFYKESKALRLWQFYGMFHTANLEDQHILKNRYNRTTVYRNLRDIKRAGVGISVDFESTPFDLSIPSPFEIKRTKLNTFDTLSGVGNTRDTLQTSNTRL